MDVIAEFITMVSVKIVDIIVSPLFPSGKLDKGKNICRDLGRLYFVSEELAIQATRFQLAFERYAEAWDDVAVKQRLRSELRELLYLLEKFEERTKEMFLMLKFVDNSKNNELIFSFADVPRSSYNLFRQYFVDDLAPKFVANENGSTYLLRTTRNRTKQSVVEFDEVGRTSIDLRKLFNEGSLSYEFIDLSDRSKVSGFLKELSKDISKLNAASRLLQGILLKRCELPDIV